MFFGLAQSSSVLPKVYKETSEIQQVMKCNVCIVICSLLACSCYAQMQTAAVDHYLFPGFVQGIVLLKNGKTDPKLLNYNCLTEQLVFDNRGRILAAPDDQLQRVDTVYIQERKFIILNGKVVELIDHGSWNLCVEHKCNLKDQGKDVGYGGTSQTSAIDRPSAIRLGGNIYNRQLPEGFETRRYSFYWLMKNGETKQFINMKQLKKIYKDKASLFNAYVKGNEVVFENYQHIVQLIQHMESN